MIYYTYYNWRYSYNSYSSGHCFALPGTGCISYPLLTITSKNNYAFSFLGAILRKKRSSLHPKAGKHVNMEKRGTCGWGSFIPACFTKPYVAVKEKQKKNKQTPWKQKAKDTSPSKHWGCGSEESARRGIFWAKRWLKRVWNGAQKQTTALRAPPSQQQQHEGKKKSLFLAAFRPDTRFWTFFANDRAVPRQWTPLPHLPRSAGPRRPAGGPRRQPDPVLPPLTAGNARAATPPRLLPGPVGLSPHPGDEQQQTAAHPAASTPRAAAAQARGRGRASPRPLRARRRPRRLREVRESPGRGRRRAEAAPGQGNGIRSRVLAAKAGQACRIPPRERPSPQAVPGGLRAGRGAAWSRLAALAAPVVRAAPRGSLPPPRGVGVGVCGVCVPVRCLGWGGCGVRCPPARGQSWGEAVGAAGLDLLLTKHRLLFFLFLACSVRTKPHQ